MKVKNYQDLIAWQKAMNLVEDVYKVSIKRLPARRSLCVDESDSESSGFGSFKHR